MQCNRQLEKISNTGSFVINISCWNSGIVIYKNTHNFFVKMQKIWILFNHFDFYFLKSYFYWKLTRLSNVTVIFVDEIFQFVQYLYRKVHTNKKKMQIPHLTKIQFDKIYLGVTSPYMLSRIVAHCGLMHNEQISRTIFMARTRSHIRSQNNK
jgi:hypothetical protein